MTSEDRWSLGGDAVVQSLLTSGLTAGASGVHLRETARPTWVRPRAVLAQNALTVAPWSELGPILRAATFTTKAKTAAMIGVTSLNLRRAERIVVLSETMADYVRRAHPRRAGRVTVRPVTLPLDVLDHVPAPTAARDPVAAVVASVSPHKDLTTTIRALARASSIVGFHEVIVYGQLDDRALGSRLVALAADLGLDLRTAVAGRKELLQALAGAAVVVVPSLLESLGLALPEACISTPRVAAAAVPAHIEGARRVHATVDWFAPGDVEAAAEAIVTAAERDGTPAPVPATVASEWRAVVDALQGPG
jgi:glycosyltransferase involved in cell wall biosynthesis